MQKKWLLYGANGYTGKIIAQKARERGQSPILAGRNRDQIEALARELGFESRIFDLANQGDVLKNLSDVSLVLNCAGPFASTHKPLFQACLKNKVHYLDITGEIPVFERVFAKREQVRAAGIVAIPGVGFDIVPSDCLVANLKKQLPSATHLSLYFSMQGNPSPGTLKTMLGGLAVGGVIRKDGKLKMVKPIYKTCEFQMPGQPLRTFATVPWTDVSTAFHSTGIPNIEVFFSLPKETIKILKLTRFVRFALFLGPIRKIGERWIERNVPGDDPKERSRARTLIFGVVKAADGKEKSLCLSTPHAYELTADSALKSVEKVLSGQVAPGAYTASQAFGAEFVNTLDGVTQVVDWVAQGDGAKAAKDERQRVELNP